MPRPRKSDRRTDLVKSAPSTIQGRGVFAAAPLPRRRKIGQLEGKLVRLPQARKAIEHSEQIYLVEISRRYALDCSNGNDFRFLNHSCQPNCYLRVHLRRIEIYTLQEIRPGTELTVDYGLTPHKNGMPCRCGSPRCRSRI
jgi:SET domain-containing protein